MLTSGICLGISAIFHSPYLFGYETEVFSSLELTISVLRKFAMIQVLPFLNNPKDLNPANKMDLDFWDCFEMKKNCRITEEIWYWLFLHGQFPPLF